MAEYMMRNCHAEATCGLERATGGFVVEVAALCEPCRDIFWDGWNRMKRDEGVLRDQGLPEEELSRILCERVEAGVY